MWTRRVKGKISRMVSPSQALLLLAVDRMRTKGGKKKSLDGGIKNVIADLQKKMIVKEAVVEFVMKAKTAQERE